MESRDDRLPLPSEDGGDLVEEPRAGVTDDPMVAVEEGVPYTPPTDRVLTQRDGPDGPDVAGTAPSDAGELAREDGVQVPNAARPVDDELNADVIEALRSSDVVAGDRIRVSTSGRRVTLRGEVGSVDVLDEVMRIVEAVDGVEEVTDEMSVSAL